MVVEGDSPREMSEGERFVDGDGGCGPHGCGEDDGGCDGGPLGCVGGPGGCGPSGCGEDDGGRDGGPLGCEGGPVGCGEDDEIFLLPLTALAMEADDLRWDLSDTAISALETIKTCRE